MSGAIKASLRDTSGRGLVDYLILLGIVALIALVAWRNFNRHLTGTVQDHGRKVALLEADDPRAPGQGTPGPSRAGQTSGGAPALAAAESPEPPPPPPAPGGSGSPSSGAPGGGSTPSGGATGAGNATASGGTPAAGGATAGAEGKTGSGATTGGSTGAVGGSSTSAKTAGGSGSGPKTASGPAGGSSPSGGGSTRADEVAAVAQAIVGTAGTATPADRAAVLREVEKIPLGGLKALQKNGTKITVVKDSVVEALPALKGVRPRGWPPGSTWDTVPGLYDPATKQVIIATRNGAVPTTGNGHGSNSLVIHETGHAIDDALGGHKDPAFQAARNKDLAHLPAYETQAGDAGLEESYAESMARYHANPSDSRRMHPELHKYWSTDPLNKKP